MQNQDAVRELCYYRTRRMCAERNLAQATNPGEIAYWRARLAADDHACARLAVQGEPCGQHSNS